MKRMVFLLAVVSTSVTGVRADLVSQRWAGHGVPATHEETAYDGDMRRTYYRGEFLDQREIPESLIGTWCYDDYEPVMPGEGLFVHTPTESGRRYYAVTSVWAGTENASQIGAANSLIAPVAETLGTPRPVLQRIQLNNYRPQPPEYWYILWPAPPLANLPGRPYHVVVTVPPDFEQGDPMDIVNFQRGFNMMNHNVKIPPDDALRLFVESQIGYFDSLCFSNGRGTLKSFRESRVAGRPCATRGSRSWPIGPASDAMANSTRQSRRASGGATRSRRSPTARWITIPAAAIPMTATPTARSTAGCFGIRWTWSTSRTAGR